MIEECQHGRGSATVATKSSLKHNGFEKPTPIRELVDAGRALTDHNAMQHHVDILYTTLLKG